MYFPFVATKSTLEVKTVFFTMTEMLDTTLSSIELKRPGCGDDHDRGIKRSIDLSAGIITAFLNFAEIILILKMKRRKKFYEIFLLSLSVSDLMFGLSNGFVFILHAVWKCRSQDVLEGAYTAYVFFVLTSIFHLLFIALERLLAVARPVRYKTFFTREKAYLFTGSVWSLAILISVMIPTFMKTLKEKTFYSAPLTNSNSCITQVSPVNGGSCKPPKYFTDAQFTLPLAIIIADILIFIFYSLIIYYTSSKTIKSNKTKDRKLPIICMAIAATFIFLTLPYVVTRLILGSTPFWANLTLLMNSGMNSIVYFFRGKLETYQRAKSFKNVYTTNS